MVMLDGTDYLAWSQSALLYINGKNKEEYLIENIVEM